jgi:hypothetical protein
MKFSIKILNFVERNRGDSDDAQISPTAEQLSIFASVQVPKTSSG